MCRVIRVYQGIGAGGLLQHTIAVLKGNLVAELGALRRGRRRKAPMY